MNRVYFNLPFNTHFGQELLITGSINELRDGASCYAKKMKYSNGIWSFELNIKNIRHFTYSYILKDGDNLIYESGPPREFYSEPSKSYSIFDEWREYENESPFRSHAFSRVFYRNHSIQRLRFNSLIISLLPYNIPPDSLILISGNCKTLGNWDVEKAPAMYQGIDGNWYLSLDKEDIPESTEYKFLIFEPGDGGYIWEEGDNRKFVSDNKDGVLNIVVNHSKLRVICNYPRFAGTAIPVFSLRSEKSCGVGDFFDLKLMADLLSQTSQNVLQILPVNDTTMTHTWVDSYPYGAISSYAIHPLYLNLERAGVIKDREFRERHAKKAKRLNSLPQLDYEAVDMAKWAYIKKLFSQDGEKVLNSKEFKTFFKTSEEWLVPYAAFCFLRDKYKSADFCKWPVYSVYNKSEIEELTSIESKHYKAIAIHYFVQYHLHIQLTEAHEYANSKRIILKGDIPIGINRNSVEAWVEPHLFNFEGEAGAPPDGFSVKGQNWGFPAYRWDVMEIDGYSWWRKRFLKMSEYFDSYRIDHILGFFRIWEIPSNAVEGLLGRFNPSISMSCDEIREFGYAIDYDRDTDPFITDWVLSEYFGERANEIKDAFLEVNHKGGYRLKEQFSSQKKISRLDKTGDYERFSQDKESLISLCAEVLFVKDPMDNSRLYPRISAQFTKSFQALDTWQKESYNKVYNHFFYRRNEDLWYRNAMMRLPSLISSTGMLVCGEDLGMIPACVPAVMEKLKISTLEIERMPKDPSRSFGDPAQYPYLSVCTTGTHDTSTLRGWWEENREVTQSYYNSRLMMEGDAPQYCESWISKKIIESHLKSPSMLAILPLQDWLSMFENLRYQNPHEERINYPANPKHYWRYRMHLTLEKLLSDESFKSALEKMVKSSGRAI
jgi:4-alpha-glucanotransferase